ncbi:MAG: HAD-IA family hydrolase [Candidatus Omnitrophica bacterium]|nr:HAD-IA family hydrolase [Candidatus Omnitrophota bacterium]
MKKLIVYDLDGTLVDTRDDIASAVNHALWQLGFPVLNRPEVCRFVGRGLHYLIGHCLGVEDPDTVERGAKLYREYYAAHLLDHSRLYPGAKEVLEYFKLRKQMVMTNKPNPYARDILEALGVAGYFVKIVAGNDEYPHKPSPDAVLAMMNAEAVQPEDVLFVGDSPIDIETGRNAGILTIVLSHGFSTEDELKSAAPDVIFKNLSGFLQYVKQVGW